MATTVAPRETTKDAEQNAIQDVWHRYKADRSQKELRNRLVERYLPLVRYNGERIWARLPEGVELDDLIEHRHQRGVALDIAAIHGRHVAQNGSPGLGVVCDGRLTLEDVERESIVATLKENRGHRQRSAAALGIGVRTLGLKLKKWKEQQIVSETL